jgi:hypothetical protein
VGWKENVIIEIIHEDYHGPKSGQKERNMKIREIISNTQHSTPNIQDNKNECPTSNILALLVPQSACAST